MVTVGEIARPLASLCTVVPPVVQGICLRCHGVPGPGYRICYSCSVVESQLSHPCSRVVPVSLYAIPSQLHTTLKHYKSGTYPADRQQLFAVRTVALLIHFLTEHRRCITDAAGGDWDVVTSVPSSGGRLGQHPLPAAIGLVTGFREQCEDLLTRGTVQTGHLTASDQGFQLDRPVTGRRVLLVDDTFTSGARAQSAASALALGGASVVAIVPVGRVIRPEFSETTLAYWNERRRETFDFDVCCLE